MAAPINVKLQCPTDSVEGWAEQEKGWVELNNQAYGNPEFYPLTVKFAYVFGVIYGLCLSAAILLRSKRLAATTGCAPAYGLLASATELLGRCVCGETRHWKSTLVPGLRWLARPCYPGYMHVGCAQVLVQTERRAYTIEQLDQLRNFAAHGQATSGFYQPDVGLPKELLPLMCEGIEHYWKQLQCSEEACNQLAKADVKALYTWPVGLTWRRFQGGHSITDVLNEFRGPFTVESAAGVSSTE